MDNDGSIDGIKKPNRVICAKVDPTTDTVVSHSDSAI
jgi:hypothetical protein